MGDGKEDDNEDETEIAMKTYMFPSVSAPGPKKVVIETSAEECKQLWRPCDVL